MAQFRLLSIAALAILALACGRELPRLEGVDLEKWSDDRNGCAAYRIQVLQEITRQKDKLLALDELKVNQLLGKPDRHELYKRSQKFYHYYIDPSEGCENPADSARALVLRFNAMGLVKEVLIEREAAVTTSTR